ncbi:HNH endonuclease [Salmonella enterica]|nr:HNH endonuclease [Salmonella enterica]
MDSFNAFSLLAPDYRRFIDQCKGRNGGPAYYGAESKPGFHAHHITPFSAGGTDEGSNCVWLTPEEHLRAHELLAVLGGMYAHTFISMSHNPMYNANPRQKLLARTMARGLYKDRETFKSFFTSRDPGKKKRRRPKKRAANPGRKSATGFYGVYDNPSSAKNPFICSLVLDGEKIRIGNYKTAEQAAIDYDIATIQLDREHQSIKRNFPDLTLAELRRLNLALHVPVIKPQPEPKPKKEPKPKPIKAKRGSAEHSAKMSAARKGKKFGPMSEEHKAKIRAAMKGRTPSPEQVQRLKEANPKQTQTCPHCGYQGAPAYMRKYHLDNCRQLKKGATVEKEPCTHCGKLYTYYYLMNTHLNNCKHNPANQ